MFTLSQGVFTLNIVGVGNGGSSELENCSCQLKIFLWKPGATDKF